MPTNEDLSLALVNRIISSLRPVYSSIVLASLPHGQGLGWVSCLVRMDASDYIFVHFDDGRYEVRPSMIPVALLQRDRLLAIAADMATRLSSR